MAPVAVTLWLSALGAVGLQRLVAVGAVRAKEGPIDHADRCHFFILQRQIAQLTSSRTFDVFIIGEMLWPQRVRKNPPPFFLPSR
jgi:hypothetical protein